MASVTEVRLVDDLDGSEASETVNFGLDGKHFEIDLSGENAERLRGIVAEFVAAARRSGSAAAGRSRRAAAPSARREDTSAVREWASQNGHQVSARGRISAAVIEAYENRGKAAPVAETPAVETPAAAPQAEPAAKPARKPRKPAVKKEKVAAS
jgi:hypothetical protein